MLKDNSQNCRSAVSDFQFGQFNVSVASTNGRRQMNETCIIEAAMSDANDTIGNDESINTILVNIFITLLMESF